MLHSKHDRHTTATKTIEGLLEFPLYFVSYTLTERESGPALLGSLELATTGG
jgi:hypothetical protein